MRAICVDDERQTLQHTLSLCEMLPQITAAEGFTDARKALAWLQDHAVELAILDVRMPEMDGFSLARAIREQSGGTAILFVTAHPQYAADAWEFHPTGFVIKPLTEKRLAEEVEYAEQWRSGRANFVRRPRVEVRTFGNFDLIVEGKKISFPRSKAKELLASLVDRRGIRMTRSEVFHVLWEDEEYTRAKQKMLDVIIRSLRSTLEENGIGDILQIEQGTLRVVPEALDCDLYRLLKGDPDMIRAYQGEYMSAYSWSSATEGRIETKLRSLALV